MANLFNYYNIIRAILARNPIFSVEEAPSKIILPYLSFNKNKLLLFCIKYWNCFSKRLKTLPHHCLLRIFTEIKCRRNSSRKSLTFNISKRSYRMPNKLQRERECCCEKERRAATLYTRGRMSEITRINIHLTLWLSECVPGERLKGKRHILIKSSRTVSNCGGQHTWDILSFFGILSSRARIYAHINKFNEFVASWLWWVAVCAYYVVVPLTECAYNVVQSNLAAAQIKRIFYQCLCI